MFQNVVWGGLSRTLLDPFKGRKREDQHGTDAHHNFQTRYSAICKVLVYNSETLLDQESKCRKYNASPKQFDRQSSWLHDIFQTMAWGSSCKWLFLLPTAAAGAKLFYFFHLVSRESNVLAPVGALAVSWKINPNTKVILQIGVKDCASMEFFSCDEESSANGTNSPQNTILYLKSWY